MNNTPARVARSGLSHFRGRRFLAAIALLVLLFSSAAYTVSRLGAESESTPTTAPPRPRVTVAPVEQQLLVQYEELLGRVEATETVEVRPRVSGHLRAVRFNAGEVVEAGAVLFEIDPRWYQAAFDLASAELERARAEAVTADREARRARELLADHAISVEEADARAAKAAEARAEVAAAEARLATARLDLEYTSVRAPIRGRVSRALVTPGNLVSGNPANSTLLTTIVSVEAAYVYADIDEATLLKFNRLAREGRILTRDGHVPVTMKLTGEDDFVHAGHVESADNHVDPETGSLVLRMVFPNTDGDLLPGLTARVRFPVSAPEPTLLISERAVGTDQSQKYVLTVDDHDTVAYRTVQLGSNAGPKRIVLSGLSAGEQVIVNGLMHVRPGMQVIAETVGATAATPDTKGNPRVAAR